MQDLSAYLTSQLAADGGAPAAVGDVTFSYASLADRVESVVEAVKPLAVAGEVVALDIRTPALGLVAALAADRLGQAYLPLDTAAPMTRQQRALENSAARVVLRETDPLRLEAFRVSARRPAWPLADPGYIIYTSGTTGRPKGIHVPKRSLIERLEGLRERPGFGRHGSFLALSALSFDMSVVETLLPLAAGGAMVTADTAARRNVEVFDHAVHEYQPDVAQATPSFFRLMLASGWTGSESLTIWCGGEAMTPDLASALHERCAALWNMYGPTEATVWTSAWRVVPGQPISLGTELPGTVLDLVGPDGEVVTGTGLDGEIRISGAGIADGYLDATPAEDARFRGTRANRSYLTGDRARRNADSSLTFLGRSDNQVKVRGHRIEMGEIESALESHPVVTEAIVALVDHGDPDTAHLSAAVVARARVNVRDLRRWLAERLPAAMIPQVIQVAAAFPRTSAGKLDRVTITARLAEGRHLP